MYTSFTRHTSASHMSTSRTLNALGLKLVRCPLPLKKLVLIIDLVHAGEVYALTEEDLKEIASSGQIGGEIVLTIPLAINTPPFVNVLVSNQLSRKFSRTRSPPTMMHLWRALLRTVWWK